MISMYKTSMGGADVIKEARVEWASQLVLVIKNPPANVRDIRDMGSTPGSRKPLEEGMASHSQYSCLENPMDRGA